MKRPWIKIVAAAAVWLAIAVLPNVINGQNVTGETCIIHPCLAS